MSELWLPLQDIPAQGREFSFTDEIRWAERFKEHGLDCRVTAPLAASLLAAPTGEGCRVSGRLSGEVVLPCDRCAAETRVRIEAVFDEYESPAESQEDEADNEPGGEVESGLLRRTRNGLELDAAGFIWEQFLLALPSKPLCKIECKGLCPMCGRDLNQGECDCEPSGLDPRLEALRNLKIS